MLNAIMVAMMLLVTPTGVQIAAVDIPFLTPVHLTAEDCIKQAGDANAKLVADHDKAGTSIVSGDHLLVCLPVIQLPPTSDTPSPAS